MDSAAVQGFHTAAQDQQQLFKDKLPRIDMGNLRRSVTNIDGSMYSSGTSNNRTSMQLADYEQMNRQKVLINNSG